jgi:hypothetical protein
MRFCLKLDTCRHVKLEAGKFRASEGFLVLSSEIWHKLNFVELFIHHGKLACCGMWHKCVIVGHNIGRHPEFGRAWDQASFKGKTIVQLYIYKANQHNKVLTTGPNPPTHGTTQVPPRSITSVVIKILKQVQHTAIHRSR